MLHFNSLLLFSEAPKKLADFYREVLARGPKQEEEYSIFDEGACALVIGPHSKVHGQNRNPDRIIINFETNEVKGEFERLKKLGAKVIAEPYQMGDNQDFWIATLADPDGNYFQLVSPMKN
jgi:predicted enzyme related to lactoylglutathione lyase